MRDPLDRYYTPDDLAEALVATLPIWRGQTVVEPSCGGGAFVRALQRRGARVVGVDLDPEARGVEESDVGVSADWLRCCGGGRLTTRVGDVQVLEAADWVVGNPPYSHAEEHARQALEVAPRVAMLLRLAFLETQKRIPFWSEHPASEVHVLMERPSFTGGGTDSCAYGWFVWGTHDGPTRLHHMSWRYNG